MNFFKKNKEIEIITPLEGNLDVQAFAEQYAKAGTIIEVKVHGSLYQSDGNMVSVRSWSISCRSSVQEDLRLETGLCSATDEFEPSTGSYSLRFPAQKTWPIMERPLHIVRGVIL